MSAPMTDASTAVTRESTVTTGENKANQAASNFDGLSHAFRAHAGTIADMPDQQEAYVEAQQEATRLEQNAEIRRGRAMAASFIRKLPGM